MNARAKSKNTHLQLAIHPERCGVNLAHAYLRDIPASIELLTATQPLAAVPHVVMSDLVMKVAGDALQQDATGKGSASQGL